MKKVYLSKTKYCKGKQCNKIIWLEKYKPEEIVQAANESIFQTGKEVGELAKGLFGEYIDIEFNREDISKMINQTEQALLNKPNIITEASFNYENNFCSVDILKNDIDGIEIYEVKSSTEVKDIYLDDISYQVYILLGLGYKIKSANIVHINRKYVRKGDLELNKLFKVEDVTQIVFEKQEEIKNKIEEIYKYMQNGEEPEENIGRQCFEPYKCEFWNYCTRNLPEKNVFMISKMGLNKKLEFYNKGLYKYEDLVNEELNQRFKQQIEMEVYNKEPEIQKEEIKEFLDTLYYPLYFLDFETLAPAIPQFDGTSPYMQMPFQYSIHYIENEIGELQHKEFLAEPGKDPRRELAERLVKDIPENACVLAYNKGFENDKIQKLAKQYPDLSEKLLKISENLKDLMIPFLRRMYYAKEMEGSYSIKEVLPALFPDDEELSYKKLEIINNGGDAMSLYDGLEKRTKEEQEKIKKALLEYCKLDTLAMVKILEKLKNIVK